MRLATPFVLSSLALLALSGCGGGGHDHPVPAFSVAADVVVGAGASLSDVAVADFDRNGALDLATVGRSSGAVSVALGSLHGGDGQFGTPVDFAVGGQLSAVIAADLDADGKLDLAVCDEAGDRVVILRGDGAGSFGVTSSVALATGSDPTALAAGDFDGDGRLDLAVAGNGDASAWVARGVGGAAFAAPTSIGLGAAFAPTHVLAADLDRDGDLDLALCSGALGSVVVVSLSATGAVTGTGTFAVAPGTALSGIVAGDFDEDGDLDLAVTERDGGRVHVLKSVGAGVFLLDGDFAAAANASGLVAADLDRDGHLDLATGATTRLAVLYGAGDATFSTSTTFPAGGTAAVEVAVGDLDSDGAPDLVCVNSGSGTLGVLLGRDRSTSLSIATRTPIATSLSGAASGVLQVDVDEDGRLDLVVCGGSAGTVSVALGNGDGTYGTATLFSTGVGTHALGVAAADLDANGHVDLAVATGPGDGVAILAGDGTGSFLLATTVATGVGSAPRAVAIADLDGDGRLDLAAAGSSDLAVALGGAGGTFGAAVGFALGGAFLPSSLAVGDFDGDGRLDVALGSSASGAVMVLRSSGPGTFAAPVPFLVAPGGEISGLVAADLDHDGDLDLAAADRTDGSVRILLGDGAGGFSAGSSPSAIVSASALAAADLDRDGNLDLVVTSSSTGAIAVLLGVGDGTFATAASFSTGAAGAASVAVADCDRDGRLDVATANTSGSASVLLGAGR